MPDASDWPVLLARMPNIVASVPAALAGGESGDQSLASSDPQRPR